MARIVIVMGGPGAGKSTLCRALSQRLGDRVMYIEVDTIRESMLKGFAFPAPPFDGEDGEQFRLARRAVAFMARQYADAGVDVVIDDSFIPSHFKSQYEGVFDDPRTTAVMLNPGPTVQADRIRQRNGPLDDLLLEVVTEPDHGKFANSVDTSGWIVLTNPTSTVDETVSILLAEMATH